MGIVALVILVGATIVAVVATVRAIRARHAMPRIVTAALCTVIALAGLSMLFVPRSNSDGVRCEIIPATNVLGRDGTNARIMEEPGNWERTSWSLCIGEARKQTLTSSIVVLVAAGVAVAATRRPKKTQIGDPLP